MRKRIIGIDFSGARDACSKIWLAEGLIKGNTLVIQSCIAAKDLFGLATARQACYGALRRYIGKQGDAVFGLDFPFGLPARILEQPSWEKVLEAFSHRFDSPETFRLHFKKAVGRELKRETDLLSKTPFSPYNLRIYKQTFYGITQILEPLVRTNQAVGLPMQKPRPNVSWLVEICPASTLKKLNLYLPYKGKDKHHHAARQKILIKICSAASLRFEGNDIKETVIQDRYGDALDSLVAAAAAFNAREKIEAGWKPEVKNMGEGWVYT